MEKIYDVQLVGLHIFWSGTPTFSSETPTFCQMGVLNSCFQNPSESSAESFQYITVSNSLDQDQAQQNVGPDLAPGSKLFAKVNSRQQKSPLAGKELNTKQMLILLSC